MSRREPAAAFRFESEGVVISLAGPEALVEAELARVRDRILDALNAALRSDAGAPTGAVPTLAEFHGRVHGGEGRGAIQETILISAFHLQEHLGRDELTIDEIAACFDGLGLPPPSSLANALGTLRRTHGYFEKGSGRGRYVLTAKGRDHVRGLADAAE